MKLTYFLYGSLAATAAVAIDPRQLGLSAKVVAQEVKGPQLRKNAKRAVTYFGREFSFYAMGLYKLTFYSLHIESCWGMANRMAHELVHF